MKHCLLIFAVLFSSGCYNYRQVRVEVTDARTDLPMEGASVHVVYPIIFTLPFPKGGTHETNPDGIAKLPVADEWRWAMIHVAAPGHESNSTTGYAIADLREEVFASEGEPAAVVRIRFFDDDDRPTPRVTPNHRLQLTGNARD